MDIIIGGGKYGCKAVEYLRSKNRDFIVVDVDSKCLAVKRFNLRALNADVTKGQNFVEGNLEKALKLIDDLNPEYVFPTAPVHIAADMAKIKFPLESWPEAIDFILPKFPQAVVLHSGHGSIVVS
ncbi:MAG TPA: NAD-binding protein, partial [Candidatus Nanoarchaeia archaeon]|nr:NAD-binding protein [Candidatus Nanoarchaeia archaeon]